jgi:uncharacterized protein YjbI with pentapeptide repeats
VLPPPGQTGCGTSPNFPAGQTQTFKPLSPRSADALPVSRPERRTLDLSGLHLAGARLSEHELSKVNLDGADLTSANLTSANLTYAFLGHADVTDAKLTDANLTDAYLPRQAPDGSAA